jgi:peptidyl-prolyl cis-trans isomerase C
VEQKYDEARLPYPDDKSWNAFLAQQGMDPQSFRTELRVQYTVQALMQQVSAGVASEVTDEQAREFFAANPQRFETGERLRARHILLRLPREVSPTRKDEFRTRAEGLLARIRTGEDFEALAREHSEDVGSKGKGGALQVFARGQMVPAFEKAAFALQAGEVSDVVETPFGFHIIRVDEKLPSQKVALESVMKQVKEHILRERQQKAMQSFVDGLRAGAKIETFI